MNPLVRKALKGDKLSISRLISLVENDGADAAEIIKEIHQHVKGTTVIGVTGVGGSGKSTLIAGLARELRKGGKRIGIIAVDPTSPFSGGALLGDRVRMDILSGDEGVFIRSMATRGAPGGLTSAVHSVVRILDAAGFDLVIIETVGIGQDEVDVAKIADTTIIVMVPGLGDWVQTMKAGVMETGDIFVVNKADLPGADQTVHELEAMLELGGKQGTQKIPIIRTSSKTGSGISELAAEILKRG